MSSSERWSDTLAQGFALAAAAQNDPEAMRAQSGLAPSVEACATRVARELGRLSRTERRMRLRTLAQRERPAPEKTQTGRSPRALGLLARIVSKELGRDWLAAAPFPRPGFMPETHLLSLLRTLASRPTKTEPTQ